MNVQQTALHNWEIKKAKNLFWTFIVGAIALNLWSIRDFLFLSKEHAIGAVIAKIVIGIIWIICAFIVKKYIKFYKIAIQIGFVSLALLMFYIIEVAPIEHLNSIFFNFGLGFLLLVIFGRASWKDVVISIFLRLPLFIIYMNTISKYPFKELLNHGFLIVVTITIFTLFFAYYLEKLEIEAEIHKIELEITNEELKETNEEIKRYAENIEEKNQEIYKSLVYASYIQRSLLTPEEVLQKILGNNYFLIYKPKDIVSGDFYWVREKNGYKYAAVADATGHGVPAALISIYCNEALNEAFEILPNPSPAEILELTREIIVKEFSKEDRKLNEGMDICLIKYNDSELYFAGANSSALMYCPENEEPIIRLKGTPTPIGNFPFEKKKFVNVFIPIKKAKSIYLMSDGIVHQIGGKEKRKLGYKRLSFLIAKVAHLPPQQQKEVIEDFIDKWKGNEEQLDDITMLGIGIH